jgi:hypothetical protein
MVIALLNAGILQSGSSGRYGPQRMRQHCVISFAAIACA